MNSLANSDKSFSAWVSAVKETGAKLIKLIYKAPTRDVSLATITSAGSVAPDVEEFA